MLEILSDTYYVVLRKKRIILTEDVRKTDHVLYGPASVQDCLAFVEYRKN